MIFVRIRAPQLRPVSCRIDQARGARGDGSRLVLTKACAEIVIGVLCSKARPCIALPCADDGNLSRGKWTAATVVHCEEAAFVIGMTRRPQLAHDCHVFGAVLVPPLVMLGARPNAHLRVFAPLPAG